MGFRSGRRADCSVRGAARNATPTYRDDEGRWLAVISNDVVHSGPLERLEAASHPTVPEDRALSQPLAQTRAPARVWPRPWRPATRESDVSTTGSRSPDLGPDVGVRANHLRA